MRGRMGGTHHIGVGGRSSNRFIENDEGGREGREVHFSDQPVSLLSVSSGLSFTAGARAADTAATAAAEDAESVGAVTTRNPDREPGAVATMPKKNKPSGRGGEN